MNFVYLGAIVVLCYLLSRVTDVTVDNLRAFKNKINFSEFILSFLFLGIVTSVPEMFVAMNSALEGVPNLSLGNLVGANIVVLTLMVGVTALFAGKISISGFMKKDDFITSLFVTGLPVLFILDGELTRWEGVAMLASFVVLMAGVRRNWAFYRAKGGLRDEKVESPVKEFFYFLLSIGALLLVSHILVQVTIMAANVWSIPVFIIGLLVISLGTNAPELGFVIQQASKGFEKNRHIATGVLLGNTVVNTVILGVLTLAHPFEVYDNGVMHIASVFLIVTLFVLGRFMLTRNKLSRFEGLILIAIYITFVYFVTRSSETLSILVS